MEGMRYAPGEHPDMKPPIGQTGLLLWLRKNLFSSPFNIILTVVTVYFLYLIIPSMVNWMFIDSVFVAESRNECRAINDGACWGFINKRLGQFTYGFYPLEERWRVNIVFLLFAFTVVSLFWSSMRKAPRLLWVGLPLLCLSFAMLFSFPFDFFASVGDGDDTKLKDLVRAIVITVTMVAGAVCLLLALPRKWLIGIAVFFPFVAFYLLLGGRVPEVFQLRGFLSWFVLLFMGACAFMYWKKVPVRLMLLWLVPLALFIVALGGGAPGFLPDWISNIQSLGFSAPQSLVGAGLESVDTDQFGGFMLTLVIGVTGIVLSLPLGILLALGRQSNLHFIRWVCTGFIEFIRGVPLITLLFVASTMLNYFLPPGTTFDLLLRVLIMVTLFSAAYIAEVVRGGLQALPKGQHEAADAMGLKYWASMRLVVLPQALKISIPGIVNTFIGLFKDTTLVVIIGLLDPLGIGRAALSDNKWQGLSTEVYVFIALFFFICCFSMSRYSIYLENKLHTGHRNE